MESVERVDFSCFNPFFFGGNKSTWGLGELRFGEALGGTMRKLSFLRFGEESLA